MKDAFTEKRTKSRFWRWTTWIGGVLALLLLGFAYMVWESGRVSGGIRTSQAADVFQDVCFRTLVFKIEPEGSGREEALHRTGLTHTNAHAEGWNSDESGNLLAQDYPRDDGGHECVVAFISRSDTMPFKRWHYRTRVNAFLGENAPLTEQPQSVLGFEGPDHEFWPVDVYSFTDDLFMYFLTFEPPHLDSYFHFRLIKRPLGVGADP